MNYQAEFNKQYYLTEFAILELKDKLKTARFKERRFLTECLNTQFLRKKLLSKRVLQ